MSIAKHEQAIPPVDSRWLAEEQAFWNLHSRLLSEYEGQYVAIYQGQICDHDDNDEKLAERMFNKLGDIPFYIGKLQKEDIVINVPSPEVIA